MKTIAITLSVLACAGWANADEFPQRKVGLWEMSMTTDAKTDAPPLKQRICIDREVEALVNKKRIEASASCKKLDSKTSGNKVTTTSVCDFGAHKLTTTNTTTSSVDSSYQVVSDGRFEPPMGGTSQTHSVQEAKWVGACPADMHPSDTMMMTPQGELRMNMLKAFKN
jgi:hypothetical protein